MQLRWVEIPISIGFCVSFAAAPSVGQTDWSGGGRPRVVSALQPIFVENQGQFGDGVRFRTLAPGPIATVTEEGLVLTQVRRAEDGSWRGHNVRLRFQGATGTTASQLVGQEPAIARTSYLLGDEADRWVRGVLTWKSLRYADIVPGASAEIHGRNGHLEYDLVLAPGVAPHALEIDVEGADELALHDDGTLGIHTPLGTIRQLAPRSWSIDADGALRALPTHVELLDGHRLRFVVPGRDPSRTLVVDPGLVYATFVGADLPDIGFCLAADDSGAAYMVGRTPSGDFPVTPGAFQPEKAQGGTAQDLVVVKLASDGSELVYATFLGGTGTESCFDAFVDAQGELVIAGSAAASDFPTTRGAYAEEIVGDSDDGFVTKLNADGTDLVFSTLFGGATGESEGFTAVAADAMGRIVVAGAMEALDLPVSANAVQHTVPKLPGAFLARFSADVSAMDYCTYIGATSIEALSIDAGGGILAAGYGSWDSGMPTTPGAFQTQPFAGSRDAFVLELDAGGALEWCSLLAGGFDDRAVGLGLDPDGRPIVAGWTESLDFPTTAGSLDPIKHGSSHDGFIAKFEADGSALAWSTILGGSDVDRVAGFAVDDEGSSYAVSTSRSVNMPVTPNGFDTDLNEVAPTQFDLHVAKLSNDGEELLYGSFLGGTGNHVDDPRDLAIDSAGNIYVTGYTSSADFPVTPDAFDTELGGFSDIFVAKFDLSTWTWLDHALPPLSGPAPRLTAAGSLQPFSDGSMHVDRAEPFAVCTVVIGLSPITLPFKGGVMVPAPDRLLTFATNAQGELHATWDEWPPLLPEGLGLWFQAWIQDSDTYKGFTATNGLTATIPAAD